MNGYWRLLRGKMKVKELVDRLLSLNQELRVAYYDYEAGWVEISDVKIEKLHLPDEEVVTLEGNID